MICFVQAADIHHELLPARYADTKNLGDVLDHISGEMVLEVIERDRPQCDTSSSFTRWQQGFTPKEHREMLDREETRRFEAAQRELAEQREDQRDERARAHGKEMNGAAMRAGAAIALVAAVVGAGIPASITSVPLNR
ncbi:MAG: hypothetical protein IH919_07780 [Deltaproteobacteria bacterium]|nr:hypothetical protein [Deltaproteobacteria bacterium]